MPPAPDTTIRPYHLAVLLGSVRPGRFGPVVAHWFVEQAKRRNDLVLDLVDLADPQSGFAERMAVADAFVVITPEYNHSYPGPLKTAIDGLSKEWHGKPVGFVSYGGLSGGLRAVEPLRVVFAELHAMTIRETVSFHRAHGLFDADGHLIEPEDAAAAATVLLDQLGWWALALRDARARHPYGS